MWTDRIKSEWERLTNAKNCICNVFIFPLPFLILSRALLFHLTAISSSAKDCHFIFQSDPVFCRVPNNHSVDASTLPPARTHRGASMQTLTKPFKCPASGTKIGGNEISSDFKSPFKFYTMWVNWGSHQQALGNETFAFVYQLDFNSGAPSQLLFNVWLRDCWR